MDLNSTVEVICLGGAEPLVAEGRIVRYVGGRYVIDLDRSAAGVAPGTGVILSFPDGETPRIVARATSSDGNRLVCEQKQIRERERREFPRLVAGVPMRYRIVSGPETMREVDLWMKGSDEPLGRGTWYQPDEFMNFSVTGLRFDSVGPCEEGDLMLVKFGLHGRTERWHATARVKRIISEPIDVLQDAGPPSPPRIAISFEQIPPDAEAALSEMTLAIQDALL